MEFDLPTNDIRLKRKRIDETDKQWSDENFDPNQDDLKSYYYFYDKYIEFERHYELFKKELEAEVDIENEKIIEESIQTNYWDIELDNVTRIAYFYEKYIEFERHYEHLKKELEVEVNIKKERIVEENIQTNSLDVWTSHYDDEEIAELFDCHDVKFRLEDVEEEPEAHVKTERAIEVNTTDSFSEQTGLENFEVDADEIIQNENTIEMNEKTNHRGRASRKNNHTKLIGLRNSDWKVSRFKRTRGIKGTKKKCKPFGCVSECYTSNKASKNGLNYLNVMNECCNHCNLCYMRTDYCERNNLVVQINTENRKIKSYYCGCGQEFRQKLILNMHIDSKHPNIVTSPVIIYWHEKGDDTFELRVQDTL
ncbi:uncharacterized protein LOC106649325 [Trichogramma pretiosum]|uniref:uncharacterized protein LOC106649325 n=1 Tax=Trichogramma pretiosum TaxID=7493 RepID=UPI0006C9B98B|nr:uncharacterized protein LOC106649325 [Trichogramma pretiosum]